MDINHHNTNAKLTRVQFFDILCEKNGQVSNEEFSSPLHQKLYGGIVPKYISADISSQNKKLPIIPPRSMSISLDDGLQMGWAPNGYGKTFVFKNLLAPIWDKTYGRTPFIGEAPYNSAGATREEALHEVISHLDDYMSDCLKKMDWDTASQAENKLFPFRALALGLQSQEGDLGIAFFFDLNYYSEESDSNSKSVRLEVSEIAIFPGFSEFDDEEYISQPNWIPAPEDEETCWLVRNNSSFEWKGQAKNASNSMESVIYAVASFLQIKCTYLETPEQSMVDFKQRINEYGRGFRPHLAELSPGHRRPTPYDKKEDLYSLDSKMEMDIDLNSPFEKLVMMLLQNVNSVSSPLRRVQQDILVQEIGKQLEEIETILSLLILEPQTGRNLHQEEDILLYVLHELLFTETEEHESFRYTVFTSILEIFVKLDNETAKKQKPPSSESTKALFHNNYQHQTVRDTGLYYQMAESLHLEYLYRSQEVDFNGETGAEILRVRLPSAMDFNHPYLTYTALNIGANWDRWDEREAALLQLENFSELAEEPSFYEFKMLRYVMRNDADWESGFLDGRNELHNRFVKLFNAASGASFSPTLDFVKQPLLVSIYEILHHMNAMIANNGPWSISVEYDSSHGNFLFSPSNHQGKHSISPKHLSFGMRSELLMQCAMIKHILDVRNEVSTSMTHYLLILDESEVGRSEAWTKKLIDRFHLLEDQLDAISSQTVLAVSHRGIVLERGRSDGRYTLLHNLLDDEDEEF